jgi:hypothetical protein
MSKNDTAPAAASRPVRPPLSRGKRFTFGLVLLVLLYFFAELLSFFALSLVARKPFSFSTAAAQKREAATSLQQSAATAQLEVLHPYVGYVYNPDAPEIPVPGPVNQVGLAGTESPIHRRSPDSVIVGIFGGSVAYGFAREGWPELQRQLQSTPAYSGKHFILVNASLQGYKQPQQLMLLNYLLALGAQFDLVINIDGYNEMALYPVESKPSHVFPAFPRLWQMRAADAPDPVQRELLGQATYLRARRAGWARAFSQVPLRWSVTAHLAWKLYDTRLQQAAIRSDTALRDYHTTGTPFVIRGPGEPPADETRMYQQLADYWVRGSIQMNSLCRGAGTRYFHFLQPNQYVPGSKVLTEQERATAYQEGFKYNDGVLKGYPVLQARSSEIVNAGVAYRDLTGIFKDVQDTIYLDYCCHFNTPGNDIMARAIARTILETRDAATTASSPTL